jgi:hypothetical protein
MICTPHYYYSGEQTLIKGGGVGNVKRLVREELRIGIWWDLRERLLGRPKRKWEDNIKTRLKELVRRE